MVTIQMTNNYKVHSFHYHTKHVHDLYSIVVLISEPSILIFIKLSNMKII